MSPSQKKEDEPWANFSNWVHAICVVTFDLELGQAMEMIYPHTRELTENERNNICYLSFPDSNSSIMGNVQFSFRIRSSSYTASQGVTQAIIDYNDKCPPPDQTDEGYLYGYVYFRQVKDKTLKRGYFQKSVVLLSVLPLVGLFTKVLEIMAPEYFECGPASLEAACHHMDQWPPPIPGVNLTLPLLGTVFNTRLPSTSDKPSIVSLPSPSLNLPMPHQVQSFSVLSSLVYQLHTLWELVITAEPIVVMASTPTTASNTIHALRSLIAPLKFSGDFRPFFTIHDSEFKEYTTRTTAPPNVMLGVTNPFFAKTLRHWPHVVRPTEELSGSPSKGKSSSKKQFRIFDHKPGVYTKFKPFLQPDKSLSKVVLRGMQTGRPLEVQSMLLKRHFLELTQSFMIPLERYVASLMPLHRNISPYKGTPKLRPFNPDEFLSTLGNAGPHLTSGIKGDWEGLYRRFFRCVNFSAWFNVRYREISEKLTAIHIEALSDADIKTWLSSHNEVEKVDLVLRVKHKMETAETLSTKETRSKLKSQLDLLLLSLPPDLRGVLSPSTNPLSYEESSSDPSNESLLPSTMENLVVGERGGGVKSNGEGGVKSSGNKEKSVVEKEDKSTKEDMLKSTKEDMLSTKEDMLKSNKEDLVKSKDDLVKSTIEDPVKITKEDLVKSKEDLVKSKDDLVKSKDDLVKSKDDLVKSKDDAQCNSDSFKGSTNRIIRTVPNDTKCSSNGNKL